MKNSNPVKTRLKIGLLDAAGKNYIIYYAMWQIVGKREFSESVDVLSLKSAVLNAVNRY